MGVQNFSLAYKVFVELPLSNDSIRLFMPCMTDAATIRFLRAIWYITSKYFGESKPTFRYKAHVDIINQKVIHNTNMCSH